MKAYTSPITHRRWQTYTTSGSRTKRGRTITQWWRAWSDWLPSSDPYLGVLPQTFLSQNSVEDSVIGFLRDRTSFLYAIWLCLNTKTQFKGSFIILQNHPYFMSTAKWALSLSTEDFFSTTSYPDPCFGAFFQWVFYPWIFPHCLLYYYHLQFQFLSNDFIVKQERATLSNRFYYLFPL